MVKFCEILKKFARRYVWSHKNVVKDDFPVSSPALKFLPSLGFSHNPNEKKGQKKKTFEDFCSTQSTCLFLELLGWSTVALVGLHLAILHGRAENWIETSSAKTSFPILRSFNKKVIENVLPSPSKPSRKTESSLVDSFALRINDVVYCLSNSTLATPRAEDFQQNDFLSNSIEVHLHKVRDASDTCISVMYNAIATKLLEKNHHEKALELLEASCKLGNDKACFNAGVCYELGLGTRFDLDEAKRFYELAAGKGHVQAIYNLGIIRLNEKNQSSVEIDEAIELIETAARQGLLQAQAALGIYFLENQKPIEAFPYLRAAAEKGNSTAEFYLGVFYENGCNGNQKNLEKAADFYLRAANKGHVDAVYNLAVFHEFGLGGIPVQTERALELYRLAKSKGHLPAELRILSLEQKSSVKNRGTTIDQLSSPSSHKSSERSRSFVDRKISLPQGILENNRNISDQLCLSLCT